MMKPSHGADLALALHYLEMGRSDEALRVLDRAEEAQLDEPLYWYARSEALFAKERYRQADEVTRKGLALAPGAIFLLFQRCNIQARLGNLGAAEEAILAALRQFPDDPQLLCRYALLTARGGQIEKAERLLDKARRVDPGHPAVARTELTLAHLRGADKEVVRRGEERLASDPEDLYGHYLVGSALAAQGHVAGADRFLSGAARLDPSARSITEAARRARFVAHWTMFPLRIAHRLGPVKIWLIGIGAVVLLGQLGFEQLATAIGIFYLVYVAYSWIAPPLLRRWLARKNRRLRY